MKFVAPPSRPTARVRAAKSPATLGVLAALLAGSVAVSGCGTSATLDPIARAAEVSSAQSGARVSLRMQLSSSALPGGSSVNAQGYIDGHDRSGEMNMNLAGIPGVPAGGGTIEMIFAYPVIYMNMPMLAGKLPEGKTWMKLDLSKAAQAAGIDLSQLNQTDPTQFLDYLRASSGAVTTVGTESLDGVTTTHYRAVLQLSRILEHLPASEQSAAKAMLEKLGESGGIPADVWVDAQDRVRRIELSLDVGAPSTPDASGTITMDFTSYGPVPPIVPPPASEVFDATALASAGLGQG